MSSGLKPEQENAYRLQRRLCYVCQEEKVEAAFPPEVWRDYEYMPTDDILVAPCCSECMKGQAAREELAAALDAALIRAHERVLEERSLEGKAGTA